MGVILFMLTFSINRDVSVALRETTIVGQALKINSGDVRSTNHDYGRLWFSEIFTKTVEGKLGKGRSDINVDAYGYKCAAHQAKLQASREVSLLSDAELEGGARGVSDAVATYVEYNIDAILDSSEVTSIVADFISMHDYLLIEEGVNLWRIFRLARQANQRVIEMLRNLIAKYAKLEDIVKSVLTNTRCWTILEGELAC